MSGWSVIAWFLLNSERLTMNAYHLTRAEINLILEALNTFESSLIDRFHSAKGPAEKKSVELLLQEVGLIGLYLTHERVAA